jgi:hypothetical protein
MSSTTADASEAAWSPDGMRLAFVEQALDPDTGEPVGFRQIYRINADKTGRVPLTTDASHKDDVEWSPDGSKLVFGKSDLWLMNTDGSGQTQLTSTAAVERDPDWQPIVPPPPPAGYPRPKHTAPMRLSLVPAFQECAAPNRTHGPPLAFPSCAPPIKGAVDLATGTADRNGAPENMEASLKVATVVGNASTGVDEADVSIQLSITDVRCTANSYGCGPSNAIGPNDYQDVLYPGLTLRITDRYNLPAPGGRSSGTSVDIPFFWGVLCAATADTSTGGSCTSNTTIDALAGGTAVEGRRAVIETGQAEVRARADAQPFLRQGVFVP